MHSEETAQGSLAINIGLGKEGDEFYSLIVLDIEDDEGTTKRFALGDASETLEFVTSLVSACEKAAQLDMDLEGVTDEIDAEAAAMAFAMKFSPEETE